MTDSHHEDHDDFGGLGRDLMATGAVLDRRGMLRIGARLGAAFGAFRLAGCGSHSPTAPTATTTTTA